MRAWTLARGNSLGWWRSAGAPGRPATTCWKGGLARAAREQLSPDSACSLWVLGVPGPRLRPRPLPLAWPGSCGQSRATGGACAGLPELPWSPARGTASGGCRRSTLTSCGIFYQLLTLLRYTRICLKGQSDTPTHVLNTVLKRQRGATEDKGWGHLLHVRVLIPTS